jgi:thymidylate kinase
MTGFTEKPIFVVIEGLDGAGKTTCAMKLAHAIGAEYMTTPSPEIRQLRPSILGNFGGSQQAVQLFYLSTVFAASLQVRNALNAGKSVVLDRYFLSTQTYAEFRGSPLELDFLATALVPADVTIYLDAPLALRKARLSNRACTAADRETLTKAADASLRELYRQKSALPVVGAWQRLSVSDETVVEQIDKIAKLIGRSLTPSSLPCRKGATREIFEPQGD